MKRLFSITTLCLLSALACGKKEEPPPSTATTPTGDAQPAAVSAPDGVPPPPGRALSKREAFYAKLSPVDRARMERADAEHEAGKPFRARDRRDYVRPAPPDFKPEPVARKLKLTLIPQTTTLRPGDQFFYRLEVQNVGREEMFIYDQMSFIKFGNLDSYLFKKSVTEVLADGREREFREDGYYLRSGDSMVERYNPPGFDKLSSKEKDAHIARRQLEANLEATLDVTLNPGDILFTRPYQKPGEFRSLGIAYHFDNPGIYRVKFFYHNPPPDPLTEEDIQRGLSYGSWNTREKILKRHQDSIKKSLGKVESNTVTFRVLP